MPLLSLRPPTEGAFRQHLAHRKTVLLFSIQVVTFLDDIESDALTTY